jgi:type III secretion protein J
MRILSNPPNEPSLSSPSINLPRSRPPTTKRSFLATIRRRVLFVVFFTLLPSFTACNDADVTTVNTQDEAIEILTVLYDAGIDAYVQEVGDENARQWKILAEGRLFEGGLSAKALRVLRDNGLPRPTVAGREEAAKEEGLLKSVSAEKAKRLKEMEIEIERQLRLLPSVVRVKTNVAPAEGDAIELNPPPATAAVVLVCKDKEPGFTDQHVRELVAGGVPRLKPENVRVAITYEPPRPLLPRAVDRTRRTRLISGVILVSVLTAALGGLITWARRKKGGEPGPAPNQSATGDAGTTLADGAVR